MADFITNTERFFKQKSVLSSLIAINIFIFLLIKIVSVILLLFKIDSTSFIHLFELPASIQSLLYHPWTLITYMFSHTRFLHVLFNLLWLYWFGQIFLLFFNPKQMGGIYFLGGIMGGLLFIISYNLLPYFKSYTEYSFLTGSSASVMAIVFATSFYRKNYEVNLFFLGRIKLIYIALFLLVLDLISINSDNPGGHIAHIGGALSGILFSSFYKKGVDLTSFINSILDNIKNLFTQKKPKKQYQKTHKRPESDYDYNKRKNDELKEIDRILDKIKKSGYNCLTEEEKKKLFNANKR